MLFLSYIKQECSTMFKETPRLLSVTLYHFPSLFVTFRYFLLLFVTCVSFVTFCCFLIVSHIVASRYFSLLFVTFHVCITFSITVATFELLSHVDKPQSSFVIAKNLHVIKPSTAISQIVTWIISDSNAEWKKCSFNFFFFFEKN